MSATPEPEGAERPPSEPESYQPSDTESPFEQSPYYEEVEKPLWPWWPRSTPRGDVDADQLSDIDSPFEQSPYYEEVEKPLWPWWPRSRRSARS